MKYLKFWKESFEIPVQFKVEIEYPKIAENRQSSFWYYDKTIATVSDGFHTFVIRAQGEIDVSFTEDGESYGNEDAVKKAMELKLTDNDLDELGRNDRFNRNNWFLVEYYHEESNEDVEVSIVPVMYDDAIEIAKESFDEDYIMNQGDCRKCKKIRTEQRFDL